MKRLYSLVSLDEAAMLLNFSTANDLIRHMYVEEYHSIRNIAHTLGCGMGCVRNRLLQMGVKMRARGGANNTWGRRGRRQPNVLGNDRIQE